ncbi:glycosyltransferase family 9 protein [Rhizobium oryzihabitans]|uniref:glycosyltransferase family 9 protein n=1 Tax=Rhizobium oryzihabitans TaxID=2267833 RepID=UPI004037236B
MNGTEFSNYEDAYAKWRETQTSTGTHYLPIFQAIEARKGGLCTVHVDGVDSMEFSAINPQIWSLVSAGGNASEKAETYPATLQFDIFFKRSSTLDSLEKIHTCVSDVDRSLLPNGLMIFEQRLDQKTAKSELEEALHRWRYVLDTFKLRILAKILMPYSGGNDGHQQSERATSGSAYLTIVVCRDADVENPLIKEVRRAIDDIRAITQFENLPFNIGTSQVTDGVKMSDHDLSDIWQMHYTLQAQASTAEAMIASLSETAVSAKDASRRLLKTERRVLALRKQTSLFLPITYPWSVFAGLVLSLIKKTKAKRKKKHISHTSEAEPPISASAPENGVVVENRTTFGLNPFGQKPKILILKLDHIGDFFLSLPAVDVLKRAWPDAEVTLVCSPTNGDLARASGYFDSVIEYKFSAELSQDVQKAQLENYANIKRLVPDRYDLAIDLRHDPDTRPLLMFIQAAVKAGFQGFDKHFMPLNISLPPMGVPRGLYQNAHNIHRLMLLSSHVVNTLKGFDSSDATSALIANGTFNNPFVGSRYVVIAPGGGTLAKKWAPSKFAELARRLVSEDDLKIVVVGGNAESEYRDAIFNAIPEGTGLDLIANLPLVDLASVIANAQIFVGTDTGATHLAALIGVPTVVVFSGVADHNIWQPMGKSVAIVRKPLACSPCHIARIEDCVAAHQCMTGISVDVVLDTIRNTLSTDDASDV